ncbi:ECF transporter S component [Paramaledivibacter caminithermalis]|jgi:riboflavin transporter FmnP|uniref:Riboflavin transporter n=1 Tax=Paramaledivibacter caminithermalis (strain DSM 15212 / CIP 107654 / DViRD3) TaxID=1121301 RepID=A0A1M6KJV9_PARC5|nr:ECF transporter S component [Paramaledivibacter caminithermalis]SHJ59257.1 Riboflavin transporter FmnP [Paramaledivibacter caminithermalis DSM 15212]
MEKTISKRNNLFDVKHLYSTNSLVKISLLSVISYILMLIDPPIPFFPGFLKMDLSDMPALIGTFALGPIAGVIIEFIKNLLHLITRTSTGGVGEFANFLIGSSLIIPSGIFYAKNRKKSTALLGMLLGTILMAIVGGLANYYILIPFYAKVMPLDKIIAWSASANAAIKDLKTLIIYAIVPFNLLKGIIISIFTILIYKKISHLLIRKIN